MPYRFVGAIGGREYRHVLRPGENLVGSDPGCDLRLDEPTVSRHHAVLVVTPDGLQVADLGSSNGTLVAGHVVRGDPVEVAGGSSVAFGTVAGRIERIAKKLLNIAATVFSRW